MNLSGGRRLTGNGRTGGHGNGKVVVSQFVTLDGVIEDPGGAEDFERGGWAFKFDRGDEGDRFKLDEVMASDALLLGRETYEGFAEAWPARDGRASPTSSTGCRSTSSRRRWRTPSGTTRRDRHGAASTVGRDRAAQEPGGDILVNGSVQLCGPARRRPDRRVAADGLPDRARQGKRLFAERDRVELAAAARVAPAGDTLILIYVPRVGGSWPLKGWRRAMANPWGCALASFSACS